MTDESVRTPPTSTHGATADCPSILSDTTIPAALARLFRGHPSGFMIVDDAFRYLEVNEAWCAMTGYSKHELTEMSFLEITHPDDRSVDRDLSRRLFSGEIPYFELDKRWIRSDLSVLHGHLTASVLHREGAPNWGLAIIDPVTPDERWATDEDSVEVRVRRTLGREFVDMLTAILGNAEAIEADLGPHASLPEIEEAVERATLLARGLLAIAPGPEPDSPASSDVHEVLDGLRPVIEERLRPNVELQLERTAGFTPVRIPPLQLDQALLAVVLNARDAMTLEGGTISIRVEARADDVLVTIADTGPGMSIEIRERMFDPFFSTKSGARGSGLTLALARVVVESTGGWIRARSEPGLGTVVSLALPRADRPAPTRSRGGPPVH